MHQNGDTTMDLTDYEPTAAIIDDTPRSKASQAVAAAHRAQNHDTEPITPLTAPKHAQLLVAIIGVLSIIGVLALAISQHGAVPSPTPLRLVPTAAPAKSLLAAPTAAPAPSAAPTPTIAPTASPKPTALPTAAPQTGQGLTLVEQPAVEVEQPVAAPSYIDNVGAQAEHSPRGGLCGPTSGDCAPGVPYGLDNSQYIANVGAQVPHKVR
jgi:hypothetical protein